MSVFRPRSSTFWFNCPPNEKETKIKILLKNQKRKTIKLKLRPKTVDNNVNTKKDKQKNKIIANINYD